MLAVERFKEIGFRDEQVEELISKVHFWAREVVWRKPDDDEAILFACFPESMSNFLNKDWRIWILGVKFLRTLGNKSPVDFIPRGIWFIKNYCNHYENNDNDGNWTAILSQPNLIEVG